MSENYRLSHEEIFSEFKTSAGELKIEAVAALQKKGWSKCVNPNKKVKQIINIACSVQLQNNY